MEIKKIVPKIILLVEDEMILAMLEKATLTGYGYEIIIAINGEKAIKAVEDNSNIDLILMDIDLGKGMDGTQAAEIILKKHNIPILFLSSHTDKETVDKTEKITSYGYVEKISSGTVLDASIKMAFKLFESEQKLEVSIRKFEEIFDQSPIAIEFYNEKGLLVNVNSSCLEMFGILSINEIYGLSLFENTNIPDEIKTKLFNFESVKYKYEFNFESVKYKTSRSGEILLDVSISILKSKHQNLGYIVQLIDITDERCVKNN